MKEDNHKWIVLSVDPATQKKLLRAIREHLCETQVNFLGLYQSKQEASRSLADAD